MNGFLRSFAFAWNGARVAWQGRNFRVQFCAALLVVALGLLLNITSVEWLAILILIGIVLSAEIFNTAIETLVNFVSPEVHPLAGKIKDLAAAAVLMVSFVSAIAGLIIFVPYVLELLRSNFGE
jgi:diacylglycerol kinase (ATP)